MHEAGRRRVLTERCKWLLPAVFLLPGAGVALGQAASTGSGQAASTGSGQAASTGSGQAASTGSGQAASTGSGQAASTGSGQAFPGKPIRFVTSGSGGGNDRIAREIAQAIAVPLGQPVTVENLAGGVAPGEAVARAAPDGYTVLIYNNTLWIGPLLQDAAYDAVRDFSPIAELARTPNVLVVNAGSPAKSVADLIALARAQPGELRYGASGTGAGNHLAGELFGAMAGVRIVPVNYNGIGGAIKDLMADKLQLMFPTAVTGAPLVRTGKLRALGVTSAAPSALLPGVPPVAASGLPGYEAITIFSAFAPAATPPAVVGRLNREMVRYLTRADVKEKMFDAGMETVAGSPAQLAATMKSELARMGKVIKDAGIRGGAQE
jgi:tripartite-type tricarboxylate transporter receptor subunit TctC